MALREKVTEAMLLHNPIPADQVFDTKHPYHYKDCTDNVFGPMGDQVRQAYGNGSGGEMQVTEYSPAKMANISSSSAMTYNLLGNGPVEIVENDHLSAGSYQLQYEKQMYTLNMGSKPANLDAFLSNGRERTAIFCEMKMLEWLGTPGELKPSYRTDRYFFDKVSAYPVFASLIQKIEAEKFECYDAWQMFKHLLAIYNYVSFTTQKAVEGFRGTHSMAGKFADITLLNVVNEFPGDRLKHDPEAQAAYLDALKREQAEKERFLSIVNCDDVTGLFRDHCNATIRVHYLSAKDFAGCLKITDAKRKYLERYF